MHLDTIVSHKYFTDFEKRWKSLSKVNRQNVVSPATSAFHCRQKLWQTLIVFMIITAQTQCQLPGSFKHIGKRCSPKFGYSLPSSSMQSAGQSFPAQPPQESLCQKATHSYAYSPKHKHARVQSPEGKQSPGCILIIGGIKPRQDCCSVVKL